MLFDNALKMTAVPCLSLLICAPDAGARESGVTAWHAGHARA
jgi:hypothetical protein